MRIALALFSEASFFVASMRVCNPGRSPASMIPLPKSQMIRHNSPNDSAFIGRLRGKRPD
jgi:hypothetical protein